MNSKTQAHVAEHFFLKCVELLKQKGHDYAPEDDVLRNFRKHGIFGICVRLEDKINRLENLSKGDKKAMNESLEDTLIDIANYACLAQCVLNDAGVRFPDDSETVTIEYPPVVDGGKP